MVMKKIKLFVAILLISNSINAQIILEKTYAGNSNNSSIGFVNLANSGGKYVINDVAQYQIRLYNLNHSIWKTIPVPSDPNSTAYYYLNISENLFDLDAQVECLIAYAGGSLQASQIAVINEDGNVLFSKIGSSFGGIFKLENNTFKMLFSDYTNYNKYVYSLPGTSINVGGPNGGEVGKVGRSFPNPSENIISLPYDLSAADGTGSMIIYNMNGQIVESFIVDKTFNNILLDISAYASGAYRYSISVNGIQSNSQSFIKQ